MDRIDEKYEKLVTQKIINMGLDKVISYEVFNDPDYQIKEDCKVGYVVVVPPKIRDNTKVVDVLLFFNEDYLDELAQITDKPILDLAIDKIVNSIEFDFSKDRLKKGKENVVEYSSILKKYGIDVVIEEYRLIIAQMKDKLMQN